MTKKAVLSLVLVFVLLFSLTACTGGGASSSKVASSTAADSKASQPAESKAATTDGKTDGEPVTLNIWMAGSGDPVYDNTYRAVYDAYTAAHPNVSYELTFIPWGDYFTKLNTALVGGAGPDIFMLGYGQMGTVQAMGDLLPLNEYIPEDWDGWDDFLPMVLDVCKKDDTMYALFSPATRVYMYRKDIAQQQGVTEKELQVSSVDELMALARKLAVKENGTTVMSGLSVVTSQNSPEQQFFVNMTYQSPDAFLWGNDLKAGFATDAGVKAVEGLKSLVADGTSLMSDPNSNVSDLVLGTSAMTLSAEGSFKEADAAFPGQIGILDCDLNSLLIGNYNAVNANSKHKEIAADMLLHMFSKESCQKFAEGTGQYSGRVSLDEAYIALNPEFEFVVKAHSKSIPYSLTMNPNFNKMVSTLRTALEEIYAGTDAKTRLEAAAAEYEGGLG